MFDRFTNPYKEVFYHARLAAQTRGHNSIGPEHLLLGLLEVDPCAAMLALEDLDVDRDDLRRDVDARFPAGNAEPMPGKLPFTKASKQVITVSMEEAQVLEHKAIGTCHLLIGLLEDESIQGVLANLHEGLVRERVLARHAEEELHERRRTLPGCTVLLGTALVGSWLC